MTSCTYPEQFTASKLSRFSLCTISAVSVTFALFLLMHHLVKAPVAVRPPSEPSIPVTVYQTPDERPTVIRQPLPPRQDIIQPEVMTFHSEPTDQLVDLTTRFTPGFDGFKVDPPSRGGIGMRDGSANPLVRVEPRYPVDAARQGISGWVQLRFSVDEVGNVQDVEVVAAEPANLFNREAMRALRRWKYQPKVVDGRAIKQTNLQVQLDFTLEAN
ncbi:energy transducer TonB [Alkalimonas amylolytica]|uniref:Protein TonB n=1 Tax=Alkalimonas amylolytica TaxID=152573 RepID=A0A1H4CGU4_ALKAM|nr:energy transducer TonB [Alkalimonas amylolytica]SEA59631.1 protein TonB [Alkalimonas amylolytica]